MNRSIKFRAWTGYSMEYKVMAGYLGAFYCDGMNPKDSACLSEFNTIYHDNTPIMQYTGLKDKNGKEIFEGDILSYYNNEEILEVQYVEEYAKFGAIILKQDGEETENDCFRWFDDVGIPSECEVIGNIYENPELLAK